MNLKKDSVFANRYILLKRLGKGGFSEVWLASDKLSSIDVALKIGDDSQEFCNELEMVHNLSHPNLLIPRHLDIWDDKPYLVMEYCSQGSCYAKIKKMEEPELWKLLDNVASGLQCLHDHDVLHQDIKPDNILIDDSGNYLITDFGISTRSRKTVKKNEGVAGSRAYMAAERKSMSVRASDIWALGATMYEIIEGETPFGDLGGLAQEANDGKVPELNNSAISAELKATIYAMLNFFAWDRPSAEKLLEITEDHSKIWQIVKKKENEDQKPGIINEHKTQKIQNEKQVAKQNGVSKWLVASLIALVLLCCLAVFLAVNNRINHVEKELDVAHEELIGKIEKQGYNNISDFRIHYQYLISLYKIENSEKYKGEKQYNKVVRKLNEKLRSSWKSLSPEDQQELTLLNERMKK